jgi:hypothetical protein
MAQGEPLKLTKDSFAALVHAYMQHEKFTRYSLGTRETWGRELRFMMRPECLGTVSVHKMRPALVQAYLDGCAGRPGKQAVAYSALKQLERWAIVRDRLPRPITTGVQTERPQGGHVPWSDEDVALAEKHARPDLARAITLAAETGSDLIRMCPTDHEVFRGVDGINIITQKTKRQVWIPVTPALAAAIATWERRPGPYLRMRDGGPWTRRQLSHAWDWEKQSNPALAPLNAKDLVLHGLRGTACVRLQRAGATTREIANIVGMSEPMVARYCRFSVQKENAIATIVRLDRTVVEQMRDMSGK